MSCTSHGGVIRNPSANAWKALLPSASLPIATINLLGPSEVGRRFVINPVNVSAWCSTCLYNKIYIPTMCNSLEHNIKYYLHKYNVQLLNNSWASCGIIFVPRVIILCLYKKLQPKKKPRRPDTICPNPHKLKTPNP